MRISRDQMLVEMAQAAAKRGTCSRKQVGVVVARKGRVLVTGYNGTPAGMPHCEHVMTNGGICEESVHAEANAIAFAARYGMSLDGAELYTTYSPCLTCAKLIINAGIYRVSMCEAYHDKSGILLLQRANIETQILW